MPFDSYFQSLQTGSVEGGTSPYKFAATSGPLPTGTALNNSSGGYFENAQRRHHVQFHHHGDRGAWIYRERCAPDHFLAPLRSHVVVSDDFGVG